MTTTEDIDVWKENIRKLKAYRKKYGDDNVPLQWKEDKRFSLWVENIRKYPNRIPTKVYKELKKIGFDFTTHSDWDTMFSVLVSFYKQHGNSYVPPFQYEKLFDWTVNQRLSKAYLTREQVSKLEGVGFEWGVLTDNDLKWQDKYQELVQFKNQYGHVRVPQYFNENKELGDWVSKQRGRKTKGTLSPARISRLTELGFLWKEDIIKLRERAWNDRYNELVQYKKANKHIDRIKITKEHYQLGLWMSTQQKNQHNLSVSRSEKLNAIGFRWDSDTLEERWHEMYDKLKAYTAKHGHCQVKRSEDFKLSVWLQRNKRDKYKIGKEKVAKLDQLGIKWPYEFFKEAWTLRFNELKTFKKEYGHLNIPKSNKKLYEWVSTQKKAKDEKTLPPDRIEKLVKIGFTWTGELEKQKMTQWEALYKKFKAFKERHGSAYHLKLKEHPELREWVRLQVHSKEKLSAVKREKLNAINFLWYRGKHFQNERWEQMYLHLVAYKKKHGNCDVSQGSDDKALARWVNMQRTKEIAPERRAKLTQIGFSWANEFAEKRWHQRLQEFVDFKEKNHHTHIVHHTPLYNWLYQQRKNFATLSNEKKKLLKKTGIV